MDRPQHENRSQPQPQPQHQPAHRHLLGPNQYGKAEVRLVRIDRRPDRHDIRDLNVSIALSGDLDDVHLTGSNANCLPTDTAKNTVYAFAQEHGVASPEAFALLLARHFTATAGPIGQARVRVEEYAWERLPHTPHSFVRSGTEVRHAEVRWDGAAAQVVAGLRGLTVLNATASEFWGFRKDRYTTLAETHDRVLATEVNARWRYGWTGTPPTGTPPTNEPGWDDSYAAARAALLAAFAGTYSFSLQQTLFAMGSRVLDEVPTVDEVRLELPNKHHFLADLTPFGQPNDNEVYYAADRPYGLIEGTVLRDGATALLPTL